MKARYLLIFFCSAIVSADIYQWTDDNGKVHFGDKPPDQQQAKDISASTKRINVDSSAAEHEKLGKIFAPPTPEEQAYEQQKKENSSSQQQALAENCAGARKELEFFQTERFYWIDEQGKTRNATEAERKQRITELETVISKYCE